MSKGGINCRFGYIFFTNSDLVVSRTEVLFREVASPFDGVEQIVNVRKAGFVFNSDLVRSRQSQTIRKDPSAFLTKNTGAPYRDLLGSTNSLPRMAVSCWRSSSISGLDSRYGALVGGVEL